MRISESRLRKVIRQVISENVDVGADKLVNFEFVDSKRGHPRDFQGFASSICMLVEDFEEEEYDDIDEVLKKLNLNFDGLKRLCIETAGRISLAEQLPGCGYIINIRVFDTLGFTQNDINKILEHNKKHNERCMSYDDMMPGAKLVGEEIEIMHTY